jgi:hypothetical protein
MCLWVVVIIQLPGAQDGRGVVDEGVICLESLAGVE